MFFIVRSCWRNDRPVVIDSGGERGGRGDHPVTGAATDGPVSFSFYDYVLFFVFCMSQYVRVAAGVYYITYAYFYVFVSLLLINSEI